MMDNNCNDSNNDSIDFIKLRLEKDNPATRKFDDGVFKQLQPLNNTDQTCSSNACAISCAQYFGNVDPSIFNAQIIPHQNAHGHMGKLKLLNNYYLSIIYDNKRYILKLIQLSFEELKNEFFYHNEGYICSISTNIKNIRHAVCISYIYENGYELYDPQTDVFKTYYIYPNNVSDLTFDICRVDLIETNDNEYYNLARVGPLASQQPWIIQEWIYTIIALANYLKADDNVVTDKMIKYYRGKLIQPNLDFQYNFMIPGTDSFLIILSYHISSYIIAITKCIKEGKTATFRNVSRKFEAFSCKLFAGIESNDAKNKFKNGIKHYLNKYILSVKETDLSYSFIKRLNAHSIEQYYNDQDTPYCHFWATSVKKSKSTQKRSAKDEIQEIILANNNTNNNNNVDSQPIVAGIGNIDKFDDDIVVCNGSLLSQSNHNNVNNGKM